MMRQFAITLLTLFFGAFGTANADQKPGSPVQIVGIRVGFDGRYKVGLWTPVEVILRGGDRETAGRLSLVVPDGDGVPSRVVPPDDQSYRIEPGKETTALLYARFGRVHSQATVRFQTDDGPVERVFRSSPEEDKGDYRSALSADRKLIVCLSAAPIGLEEAVLLTDYRPSRRPAVARLTRLAQLPTRWCGYEGVDALVIATSRPEVYQRRTKEDSQRLDALDRWIRLGGQLLVTAGSRAEDAADPSSPLARFLPGRWKETLRLSQITGLDAYFPSAHEMPSSAARRVSAARLELTEGRIEAREADLPLVVQTDAGFGRRTFLAVDLDQPPLDNWKDRGALLVQLLGWSRQSENESSAPTSAAHLGYSDISGQLRSALDRFDGVQIVPFGLVVGVLLAYIALVGPVDYFLLRRIGRLRWTWITFPLLIFAVSVAAYAAAHALKGREVRLHQADLVDVDVSSGLVRGTHWSNLYSPRADIYDLTLRPAPPNDAAAEGPALLAWFGLPGGGLGGMDPKTDNPAAWRVPYDFSPALDQMDRFPMQTSSTRSLTGRWTGRWTAGACSELVRRDDLPGGRFENPLNVKLENCLLIYAPWVYQIGELKPRQTGHIEQLGNRAELKTLLTGRRMVIEEQGKLNNTQYRTTLYDAAGVDLRLILRTMMFYELAGGQSYVHLSNEYQSFVDFSRLLTPTRAILVGMTGDECPAVAELCRDGRPLDRAAVERLTVYRFVLPVREPPKESE